MEIVLNKDSSRKTPTMVSLRGEQRDFADAAASVVRRIEPLLPSCHSSASPVRTFRLSLQAIRFPRKAFIHLVDLLGKKFDNPIVHLYHKRFPFYNLVPDQNRGTVAFQISESASFIP